jgi:hypothetical protein
VNPHPAFNESAPVNLVNPLRAILSDSSEAKALYAKLDIPATDLSTTFNRIATALQTFFATSAQINADGTRTVDFKATQVQQARSAALQALDSEYAADEQRRADIQAICNAAIAPNTPKDPQAALLAEMQLQRAQKRMERALDAATQAQLPDRAAALIKEAGAAQDAAMLACLRQELLPYMRSRGVVMNQDWLNGYLAPYLPAGARAALVALQELDRGWLSIQTAFRMARQFAADTTRLRLNTLPGWDGQHTIHI